MAVSDPMPKRPMDSLPYFAGMTKNGDSDGAQARSVGPESGPQGLLWPQVKNTCAIRGDSDGALSPHIVMPAKAGIQWP